MMIITDSIFEEKYFIREGAVEDRRLFGAFPDNGEIEFCIAAERSAGLSEAVLRIHSDGLSEAGERYFEYPLTFKKTSCPALGKMRETMSVCIPTSSLAALGNLFYYSYSVKCFAGEISLGGEEVFLLKPVSEAGERQLLIYDSNFTTPDFLKGANVYHIFVDRFYSSGRCAVKDGAVFNPDWDGAVPMYAAYRGAPLKNNEFFGGDLWGIIEKLDYLQSLGINTLYLSPIFESPSNHKYDASDYLKVDSMFGGDEALIALCKECKKRGMEIFLDGVFNHTGDDSVYFDRYHRYGGGACTSKKSPYYKWYTFFSYPDKYECWWNIDILPRVKSEEESYRAFIFGDGGVVDKWMKCGVAGFRLDVADELCDDFLDEMRECVRAHRCDGAVIGEVWEDASNKIAYSARRRYFGGKQLDSVMNYPLRDAVISFIKYGDSERLRTTCEGIYRRYPKCVSDVLMNFLGTHDTERILTVLAGESGEGKLPGELAKMRLSAEERERGARLLKCAYTIVSFMYGFPSVFYGDEAGAEGYHDPFCRKPYPWKNADAGLVAFFSKVGKIRLSYPVLKDGLFEAVEASPDCFLFKRYNDGETMYVCVTRNAEKKLIFSRAAKCILSSDAPFAVKAKKPSCNFCVPPCTGAVFVL